MLRCIQLGTLCKINRQKANASRATILFLGPVINGKSVPRWISPIFASILARIERENFNPIHFRASTIRPSGVTFASRSGV
jgi:hypothetical protein